MKVLKNIASSLLKDKKMIRQNLLVWLLIYLLFILIEFIADGTRSIEGYIDLTFIIVWGSILYYFHFFICYLFLEKSKAKFFISVFVTFISHFFLVYNLIYQDKKLHVNEIYTNVAFIWQLFFYGVICYLIIVFISTIYWSHRNNISKTLQNVALKQDKILLQTQLLQSENNFLRAQINPHFLYNCLNFFYSKTFVPQPEVAESIMLLSQIMRYSLADFSSTNGLANLPDEIEHIENLIKINGSRFDHKLQIKFKLEGLAAGKKITPMLLMTLVENIFKHGNLQDISSPATITCKINEVNNTIIFLTSNIKNRLTQELSSGLGLINIEHRLQLLYNENFKLNTTNTPTIFKVELVMPYFY